MPYTPSISSAIKASINDENKRQKKPKKTGIRTDKQVTAKYYKKIEDKRYVHINDEESGRQFSRPISQDNGGFSQTNERSASSSGAQEKRDNVSRTGTGGSTSRDFVHERYKIPKPVFNSYDQYGYKEVSPSPTEARRHCDNVNFYMNEISSKPPPGHKIEEMLKWKGNYTALERNHRYMQWLFPIPESNGSNSFAQQLYEHEAKAIRENDWTQKRVLKAYQMMLDFYGMELIDSVEGKIQRASNCWEDRYDNLNRSRHNLFRITRILKSIGELGYERFQARWVEFLIDEAVIYKTLPNLNGPCLMYWIMAVKNGGERELLYRKANGQDDNHCDSNSESEGECDDNDFENGSCDDLNLMDDSEILKTSSHKNENEQKYVKQTELSDNYTVNQMNGKGDYMKAVTMPKPQMVSPKDGHMNKQYNLSKAIRSSEQLDMDGTTNHISMLGALKTGLQYEIHAKKEFHKRHENVMTTFDKITAGTTPLPSDNLRFYQNNLHSRPAPGYVIETILNFKGDFDFFDEKYPAFMQWLFPIPGSTGRNTEAQPLYEHEAKEIRNSDELSSRVLRAFRMMLDYFGMDLYDNISGKFRRNKETYKKRYEHLEKNPANFLRITRIIKSIGELGFERFQVPWIEFLIKEGVENKHFPVLDGRIIQYWIGAIKDEEEKHVMVGKYGQELQYRVPTQSDETMNDNYLNYDSYFDSENIGRISPLFPSADLYR